MITVYVYAKCSTCRNALKWLDEHGIAYESRPIRETPPSVQELDHALRHLDEQIRKLFNTSGVDYRAMGMKEQLPTISRNEALKLLSDNGNLIKRPLVIGKHCALAGFKPNLWQEALND